jgi:hypothetical protein
MDPALVEKITQTFVAIEPFPYKDIWDPLGRVFDAFGMWGTDWTRAVGMLTYEQGVEAFRTTDRLSNSERTALIRWFESTSLQRGVSNEPCGCRGRRTRVGLRVRIRFAPAESRART